MRSQRIGTKHIFNPKWPPHTKFHNAQTVDFAVALAGLTLWQAWKPGPMNIARLRVTAVFAGLYWATQVPAPFFPGSAVVDPDNPAQPVTKFGILINQVTGAALLLAVIAGGYLLEARRLRHGDHGRRR